MDHVQEEVADWRDALNGHAKTLNAMRKDLVDVRTEMRDGFAKVDENFAKVHDKFELLRQGQEAITDLLTRRLGEPDEETRSGDESGHLAADLGRRVPASAAAREHAVRQ